MRVLPQMYVSSWLVLGLSVLGPGGCDAADPAKAAPNPAAPNSKAQPDPAKAGGEQIREAKDVDLSGLSASQRETFFTIINQESSACGKPHSLATSLRDDPDCRNSLLVAQLIADRLVAGQTPADIKLQIDEVSAALTPVEIDLEGRAVWGNPKAPVTIVVFADFQCPRCKSEAPVLREQVTERRGQVKLVFKHFPLAGHPRGEPAAIAVEAAHQQGKFWEMHDLVFANQTQLEDADLERYAGQIPELDVAKWKADYASPEVEAAVVRDRAAGKSLALTGTPTVFVNGRRVSSLLWNGELSAWIDDALRR
jgi:protein-disulfide isomerase